MKGIFMRRLSRHHIEKMAKNTVRKSSETLQEVSKKVSKNIKSFLRPAGDICKSGTGKVWNIGKMVVSSGSKNIQRGYSLLSNALRNSKIIGASTSRAILSYIRNAYKTLAKSGKGIINQATILVNAILASDFSRNMESWLGHMFNEGIPSYNATHIGGGYLHRLFDGSHTLWGMWDKVRDALPDDSLLQESVGYVTALGKDLSSYVGIPLFDWSKSSYTQVANVLSTKFNIPKQWFADLLHVNATELIGASIGTIAVALNWSKKEIKEFSSLAGSLGISSIASANPALAIVTLTALAKSFVVAKKKENYSDFVKGLSKGGIGTGAFLATASVVGGPVWVGLLAGTCVGAVVHKTMDTVQIPQIRIFVKKSLKKAMASA
jgi:hypothetical protein